MKKCLFCFILLLILSIAFTGSASAQMIDQSLRWKVIETEHFLIIFPNEFIDIAKEAGVIAEDVHSNLSKVIKPSSKDKTAIILLDNSDFTNGVTNPLDKSIRIWLANPNELEIGSKFESWLRLVITHEYMHILHLDQVNGVPEILRDFLGRIIIPNQFLPYWMLEGYTIYAETHYASGGRGNDSLFDMYLREMYRNNKFLEPDQVSSYDSNEDWPDGTAVYLYGGSIFEYISQKYGEEKLAQISEITSSSLPYLMSPDLAIKKVLGIDYRTLWKEWKDYISDRYKRQIDEIEKSGVTPVERLTRWGYNTGSPVVSSDDSFIVYSFSNPYYIPGLRFLDPGSKKDIFLTKGFVYGRPAISPDRKSIIYSRIDYTDPSGLYMDLYSMDLNSKKENRLTTKLRAYNPVFLSENSIFFLKRGTGTVDIMTMDLDKKSCSTFLSFPREVQIKSIGISPDKSSLCASIWREGGYQDIYIIDLEKKNLFQITSDRVTDSGPVFSPDGRFIIFSSDRTGIYNLYAYKIEDGTFYQITNLLSGAFEPTLSQDKIFFLGYSYEGYDIYSTDYNPDNWKEVQITKVDIPEPDKKTDLAFQVKDYRSIDYMLPKYWIPLPLGFIAIGQDYLGFNSYGVSFIYDAINNAPVFSSYYSMRLKYLTLNLSIDYDGYNDMETLYVYFPLKTSLFSLEDLYVGFSRIGGTNTHNAVFGQWVYSDVDGNDNFITERNASLYTELSLDLNTSAVATIGTWERRTGKPGEFQPYLGSKFAVGGSNIPDLFSIGGDTGDFILHGYNTGIEEGSFAFIGNIWLDKTILKPYRGLHLGEVFLKEIGARIYLEAGLAGNDIYSPVVKMSAGGELHLSASLGYGILPLEIGIGVAQPLDTTYPTRIYISLEGGF